MKRINLSDYRPNMGILIDLADKDIFEQRKVLGSINIPYEKLMLHYNEYLDKNKKYYIMCTKGIHSRKAVSILEYYGYDVTQVIRNVN
jgi:rhodanese-related sulfurtransferase